MSTLKFAEELTHLISRWTRPPVVNTDVADIVEPLTTEQITNTLKCVVQVMLGVYLQETSKAGSAVSSRRSSVAPTIKQKQIITLPESSFRFGSLDYILPSSNSKNVNRAERLSTKSLEEIDIVKYNTPEILPADKKFISRSNPTIHVSSTDKHDASIGEQAERGALHKATEQQGDKVKSHVFLNKIKVLRKCAADVVANIDELRKEMCPQTATTIRRLSSIAGSPEQSGSSSLLKKVPPPNLRRSSTSFTGTSTTKTLSTTVTTDKKKASARRHTSAPGSIHTKPWKISARSHSPLGTSSTTKKSPLSTLTAAKSSKSAPM